MSLFDDASLVLIPDGAKDSKLYSVKPTDGSGDFTFSRGSNLAATRVNENGLIEKGRENLLLYSEDFSDSDWLKVGVGSGVAPIVTSDQGIAPDGTLTADRVQFDISVDNIANRSILRQSHSSINGPDHCRSFYVKSFDGTDQYISIHRGGASAQFTVTNDWQRIELVGVSSGETFTGVELRGGLGSGSLTSDVLIWGAQLEVGSVATEYIQSTSTTGKAGVLEDLPRIDYSEGGCPSLLLEPQRTNLATYSEQFDNAAWGKLNATVTANATTAPDGTITADNVTWDAASGFHLVFQNFSLTSGVEYTATYFVKDNGLKYIQIYNAGNAFVPINNRYANFDIENGTLGTSTFTDASIEHYGNGWYRISVTETAQSSNTGVLAISGIQSMSDSYRPSFTGDGTSGIYIWGAQFEAGSYPTSYIPTTSAAVTRNADSCELTGVADLLGDSEGTLFVEASYFQLSRLSISDGSTSNRVVVGQDGDGDVRALVNVSSANVFNVASAEVPNTLGNNLKIAIKYQQNDFALWLDGIEVATDNSGNTFPDATLSTLEFVGQGISTYGRVKQLAVFPTALTDTQLENLTS